MYIHIYIYIKALHTAYLGTLDRYGSPRRAPHAPRSAEKLWTGDAPQAQMPKHLAGHCAVQDDDAGCVG